jgi:anti-sigma-K factor RskA
MGDIVVGQELLLGYLMNVLEEDEVAEVERELARQPRLRSKLAMLQKRLYSLDNLFESESSEPPSDLSRRTCDNIWATVQNDNAENNLCVFPVAESETTIPQPQNQAAQLDNNILPTTTEYVELPDKNTREHKAVINSENYDNTTQNPKTCGENFASVEVIDAVSDNVKSNVKSDVNNVTRPARLNRRRSKQNVIAKQPRGVRKLLLQIAISAVIGIVLAVILYPAANYFIGRVVQVVVRQKVDQLNKNVEVYTQLSDPHVQTSPEEINLTRYGWQELLQSTEYIFANNNNQLLPQSITQPQKTTNANLQDYLFLGQSGQSPVLFMSNSEKRSETESEADASGVVRDRAFNIIDEHALILNLSQPILISEDSKIRPAVGQNILIQNDRIFFRIIPQSNNQK